MASSHWYGHALKNLAAGKWAWNNSYNITIALLNGTYLPDELNHELWGDISEYEVEGINYQRASLDLVDPSYHPITKEMWLDARNNYTLQEATFLARYAVIFVDSGTPETDYLIGWIDFGESNVVQENDFILNWTTNGIFRLRRS